MAAAAVELGGRGIRANVINPGPIDTGWMTSEVRQTVLAQTPAGMSGKPVEFRRWLIYGGKTGQPGGKGWVRLSREGLKKARK